MDGDLRRQRRSATFAPGQGWGYSAIIPAELGHPLTAAPHAEITQPRPKREEHKPKKDDEQKSDSKNSEADAKEDDSAKQQQRMPGWKKALYWLVGLAILVILIIVGIIYYLDARHYEKTDDAFIDGHMSQVSAQVAARVLGLSVADNQVVQKGQLLLELDPRDFQVKLDQARAQRAQAAAQLSQAKAGLVQQQANVDQAEAQVRVTQADLGQALTDFARYKAIDPKAITRQQLDNSSATAKSAQARVDANKQAVEGARAQIEAQRAQIEAAAANLQVSDAAIANAELQLGYTHVMAPDQGRITKRTVEVGNYVNPGQSLLAVVPPDLWITANFKETQLADMKPGQPVRVRVDACPNVDLAAHIDSFQSGTGAVFSSLPAENATGNYVKVVQRVPVKIVFDNPPQPDQCRLAPGLSVSPRITVRP